MLRLHATCVTIDGAGLLLRGPSGAGKSDLALRLIDGGAMLVADDQVLLTREEGRLIARAPERLAGHIEVRGVGILPAPSQRRAPLHLVVDLTPAEAIERLPAPRRAAIAGVSLPALALNPFEPSAAAKLRLAMHVLASDINGRFRPLAE